MKETKSIVCAFCGGSGRHPYYFKPPCPVCKGKGENALNGEVQRCKYCKGSGRKSTTTLTCYYCGGVGVVARSPGGKSEQDTAVRAQYPDKDAIEAIVEETLKKYKLGDPGVARGEEAAVIKRVPVAGVLREEKEMKAYVEPISGVIKTSAILINQSVASLKDIKRKEQVAGLTKAEQRDFESTVALIAK